MAKKIRFPLKMNGVDVRTIEELREHFDLESVLGYFTNGKLATWLRDRYYDNEAMAVDALSANDEKLAKKLCSILKVTYAENAEEVDIAFIKRRQEKIALLRQFTNDESLVSKIDAIAFNQEDLLDILDTGTEKMIYLCKGEFDIPLTVTDITYVGLDNPAVTLRAYDNVDFLSLNLNFVDIEYSWNTSCITSADELYQAECLYELGKIEDANKILKKITKTPNPRALNSKIIEAELKQAEELFSIYDIKKLLPVLEELVSYGCAKAKYIMGLLYRIGFDRIKFPRDVVKGDAFLKEAYEAGYLPAFYKYHSRKIEPKASAFSSVTPSGLSMKEVFYEMKKLADTGDGFARYEYARMCISKSSLTRIAPNDYQSAFEYFQNAPLFLKYYGLACCYNFGWGVERKLSTALEYYMKSAEYGYNEAEYDVANYYGDSMCDWGTGQNPQKYYNGLCRAYNHGCINAISSLAWCYFRGYGVETDYDRAFQLMKEAVEKGDEYAMWQLAGWYEYGKGTSIDINLAKKYYRMSADKGNGYAIKQCERLGC